MKLHPLIPPADVEHALQQAMMICESRGKRLTAIRLQVLQMMLRSGGSIKAYDLLAQMQAVHPSAKPATVYRALDFLAEEGFIHRLDAINGWSACQHIHEDHQHHHDLLVVCTQCGRVKELSAPTISQELVHRLAEVGYQKSAPQVEIRAICRDCLSLSAE